MPTTFGQGHALGGSYFSALKTVQDWDSSFSVDMMPKPGLKHLLLERCEGVERHIKSIIEEVYERHGFGEVAHLARSMLTDSVKLLKVLVDYLSDLYREQTERSGFLPGEAWGLVTQCGRSVFMQLTKTRETLGVIDPKDSAYRNMSRVQGLLKLYPACWLAERSCSSQPLQYLSFNVNMMDVFEIVWYS